MPKDAPILYEYRCKICQLAKSNPDIFTDLHTQVLEVGTSLSRAMNNINSKIENDNLTISKLNNQNMSVHFSSHISLPERVNVEISKHSPTQPSLKEVNPEMGYLIEDMVRRKVGNEINDYLNLDQLRTQMTDKLQLLDTAIEVESTSSNKINVENMQLYTKLVTEIRNCIVDLNKIRQSRQLMNVIIKSLIERYTFDIAKLLTKEYDQIRLDMVASGVEESIALKMSQNLKLTAAQIIAQTARSAVEDILRTYKLN